MDGLPSSESVSLLAFRPSQLALDLAEVLHFVLCHVDLLLVGGLWSKEVELVLKPIILGDEHGQRCSSRP